ncbi:hypothetical protein BJ878DRAFT_5452 [Calycina marina]|uniref:O-fucosyltransferase family protein n=1 Tax=Calycina marina TaxID=1763456 RepID=A0A9P8CIP9_9HELO|nr:hypothetical protein BJ878DRAFT_5452 [Calycina marina]
MLCSNIDRPWVAIMLSTSLIFIWVFGFRVHDAILSTPLFEDFENFKNFFSEISEYQHHPSEAMFVKQAMAVEFPMPIDYRPIQAVCARSNFRPGLLFSCEGQHGGVGMVRNQILRCIRYAIAGGGAIVIPNMQLRSVEDISDIETAVEVPLNNMLDHETFIKHLTGGCPGMKIYEHAEDFPNYDKKLNTLSMIGSQFEPDHPKEGLTHPREWRAEFNRWLSRQHVKILPNTPVHIKMEQSFLEYPVQDDGVAFVHEYGKILSFRHDTRALAAKVLFALDQKFALNIDPRKAINANAYYGAHLRLEKDALDAWPPAEWRFSRMDQQFEQQFRNIERSNLSVVYVASGNQTVVDLFAVDLARQFAASPGLRQRNISVITKHGLLRGADREALDSLPFDQRGLVDFLLMFKASKFMGVASSSFPWTVALRRHELSRYKEFANEGSDLLRDELSVIMGSQADYPELDPFLYGLWP